MTSPMRAQPVASTHQGEVDDAERRPGGADPTLGKARVSEGGVAYLQQGRRARGLLTEDRQTCTCGGDC